ncbi:potassium transporter Kup [Opitutus terrae]|uniref:Probable potassium transport system protein Kup n=1 Tax=Opitutus terrae (strain DSM 11246 / JCM 15787 / PB90-1) TaxID=452637 RepID=B1ZTC6_OPITP|nr:KUP/HAK/KT family potassium transporter [Opitutus terrae]ACB76580.1 K potassium transporter [Opitutus terrae PB90-1]
MRHSIPNSAPAETGAAAPPHPAQRWLFPALTSRTDAPREPLNRALVLGALGVVFGDIGTSPLYALKECMANLPAGVSIEAGVLGAVSLVFWALVLIVCVKYVTFICRADNRGEGGVFALMALLHAGKDTGVRRLGPVVVMLLAGAALLYGDGVITPAISVLGAAEGFTAIDARLESVVVPASCLILLGLFWFQHHGTMRIGRVFGPVMAAWFAVIALLGLSQLMQHPGVLRALNPLYALAMLRHPPGEIVALLGAVVLAFTGTEALYADMGHFGRRAIQWAWYGGVFPALLLSYFGQGAYILAHPGDVTNSFYALAPQGWARLALTGLAFVAAVIASQALISGSYSLTRQAIQLGYLPRLKITHTHAEFFGQIYLPLVNALLAFGSILAVVSFRSTAQISAAYGIAVTGTMAITTVAYFLVARRVWRQPRWVAFSLGGLFLFLDLGFFGANLHKLAGGGWFPLAIGAGVFAIMCTWKIGRAETHRRVYGRSVTEDELTEIARSPHLVRPSGAAVYLAGWPEGTPIALLHQVKSSRALHQTVVLLSLMTEEVPTIDDASRLELRTIGEGIWRAVGRYGFMESPDAAELMERVRQRGVPINPATATYYFNRESILPGGDARMARWQIRLYDFLLRNATPAKDYFHVPPAQIVEIGMPLQL